MTDDQKHRRVLSKGSALYSAGDPSGTIYIVQSGEVALETSDGEEIYTEGEVIGAFDSILRSEYSKTARAVTACTVTLLSVSDHLGQLKDSLSLKLITSCLTKTDQTKMGQWS